MSGKTLTVTGMTRHSSNHSSPAGCSDVVWDPRS